MRIRLGVKFILLVVTILSLTLVANAYYSLRAEHNLMREQLLDSGRTLGHMAAYLGAEAIIAYDFVTLENYVQDVSKRRDVIFGVFLDAQEQPLTSYLNLENRYVAALAGASGKVSIQDLLRAYTPGGDEQVWVNRFPIIHHDKTIGHLVLGISLHRLNERFERALWKQLSVSSMLILVLAFGIYLVFRFNVLRPIRKLEAGALRVKEGEFSRPVEVLSRDEFGALTESFNAMMDEVHKDRELLNFQANYDSLTKLPNRLMSLDRFSAEISRASREQARFAVLFIDLDNFKIVNDTMGHQYGDDLLVEVSERLKAELRESDTLARQGGDEFLVLLPKADTVAEVDQVARRLIKAIEQPIKLGPRELFVQCSIGAAFYPDDGESVETLMANADNAMYQAKRSRDEAICFFSSQMNIALKERLLLENDLHLAIERGELQLEFQSIVNAEDGGRIGAEVVLHWNHPAKGVVSPEVFIPLAESTQCIISIGGWMLREACRKFSEWVAAGLAPGFIAVNVSRIQLTDDLLHMVEQTLEQYAMDPAMLHLEITESVLTEYQNNDIQRVLRGLNGLGVKLVLDDFGSGFLSLNYLKHFPFHMLKIDKSFVASLPEDEGDVALVRGIITMASGLGLKVVGEGVERDVQWQALRSEGSHMLQGNLFGHPMDERSFAAFLRVVRDAGRR